MSLFSWLRNRTSTRSRRGRAQHRSATERFRPQLEALEDRCVPSTLKVTNLGDGGKGSLRYEIAAAQTGDTIVFDKQLNGGTITLRSNHELLIGKNLTIQGPGAGLLTITSGQDIDTTRIFEIDSATVTLSGLTISNSRGRASAYSGDPYDGQGGGILNFGKLTISGCTVTGNSAENGGGIYNTGTLTVNNSTLSDNGLPGIGFGGGIYNAGTLTVSNSTFSSNTPDNIFGPYTDGGGNTFK
jgi:hypothetical protein